MAAREKIPFVGRGGLKLSHALTTFGLDVKGMTGSDFGCNVGGFTDCLLQAGAARVYAVDTGYGALAYPLRIDPRVIVMERTNALHADPPDEPIDLIVIDLAWTPQSHAIPAALRWLRNNDHARIITLVKPHYEAEQHGMKDRLKDGVLPEADAEIVLSKVLETLPDLGVHMLGCVRSPLIGGAGKGKKSGNVEWLALLAPTH